MSSNVITFPSCNDKANSARIKMAFDQITNQRKQQADDYFDGKTGSINSQNLAKVIRFPTSFNTNVNSKVNEMQEVFKKRYETLEAALKRLEIVRNNKK